MDRLKSILIPDDLPVLDPGVLTSINKQLGESRNVAGKLIETFSSTSGRHLEQIEAALKHREDHSAARAAHALKGGALTIGLTRLAHACAKIEKRLSSDDSAEAVEDHERAILSKEIRSEHEKALVALSRWPH